MKTREACIIPKFTQFAGVLLLAGIVTSQAQTTFIKQGNATAINAAGSWSAGGPPGSGDIGEWTSVAGATGDTIASIGGAYSLGQIQIFNNVAGAVSITDTTAANILTLNGATGTGVGLDMSVANQNLTLGVPLSIGVSQTWKIASGRSVTHSGPNGLFFGANVLNIVGPGTFFASERNNPVTASSSSAGAGIVLSNAVMSCTIQTSGASAGYINWLGANTALTMAGNSTFTGGEVATSGNHKQTFTSLTLNPGTSLFTLTTRLSSSGNSIGFTTLNRNGGSIADFTASGSTTAFGGSVNTYAIPGTTILGFATIGANDWAKAAGGATTLQNNATYVSDVFTTSTSDVTVTANDSPATFTINSLRFNAAGAFTATLTGVNTITSGGILVGSTVGANATTITGGSLTSGNSNADGTHDLMVINNNTTASSGVIINSVIADNGGNSVGLTVGSTTSGTPSSAVQLGSANTFSGTTTITKGTLQINNSLSLQNSTLATTLPGTLSFGSLTAATLGGLSGSGTVALPSSFALTLGNNNVSSVYGGVLSGTGATVTKTGTGTLTFNGANLYTGNTTINNGTLALGASGAFGGTAILASTATLDVSSSATYSLAGTVSGTGTIKGALSLAGSGQLSPTGTSGILTLSSNLTLNGGTVAISVASGGAANGVINIGSGGIGNLTLSSGTVQLNITGTLPNGTYKIIGVPNGTISGSGSLISVSGFAQAGQAAAIVANTHELDLVVSTYIAQNLIWLGDGSANLWNVNAAANWNDTGPTPANPSVFKNGDRTVLDDSSANTTANLSGTLSPLALTVNGTVNSYTLAGTGKISGSAAVTNNNNNTLTILTTNDYSGGTVINAGSIQVGNGTTAGGAIGSGPVKDNGALAFVLPATSSQGVGAISGSGTLATTGAGTVILNGADTLAGATTISAGTLKQGAPNVLPNGAGVGDITVNGTLDMGGQSGAVNGLFGSATGVINNSGIPAVTLTVKGDSGANPSVFGGLIQNTGGALALNFNSSGNTLQLTTNNTYTGGTTITAGTIQLGTNNAIGGGGLVVSSGAALDLNGFSATVDALTGSGIIDDVAGAGTSTLTIDNNGGGGTFSGVIQNSSGTVNLAKNGAGTEILTGNNTYAGTTVVNAGVLQLPTGASISGVGASSVAANGAGQFVINGGTLTTASFNIANPSVGLLVSSGAANISGALTMNAGASSEASTASLIALTGGTLSASSITIGRGGASFTVQPATGSTTEGLYVNGAAASISGNVGIGVVGGTGPNSSATIRIDSGSLAIGGSLSVGLNNGGRWSILDCNGGFLSVGDTGTGLSIGGPFAGNVVAQVRAGTNSFGKISFGQGTVSESNVLIQTAGYMYIGNGGMAQVTSAAGPLVATIYLAGGVLGASDDWSSSLFMLLTGTSYTIQTADVNGNPHNILLAGALGGNAGSALTVTGGGKLTLTAANFYTSGTTVNASKLNINGIFALGGANYNGLVLTNGATLQYSTNSTGNGSTDLTSIGAAGLTIAAGSETIDLNGNNVTYANTIGNSGSGSLTLQSTIPGGVLTLSGANTYTGNTTVSGGTLNVNGSIASANVTVNGGILGGTGTIAGSVDVQSGGGLAPGSGGVGTNHVNALTLESGSINNFEFNGTANDQTVVANSGGFVINDGSDNALFNLYAAGGTSPYATAGTYKLIQFTGTAPSLDSSWTTSSGTNPHIGNPQVNHLYSFATSGGYLTLTISVLATTVSGTWTNNADGSWTTGANWDSNPKVPHAAGDLSTFGTSTALRTVTLNANETNGTMTFNNANSFVIANAGNTLTIDNTGAGASIFVLGGVANSIQTKLALNDNTAVNVSSGSSLAVSGVVANAPSVNKTLAVTGSGTLALSGNNSYGPAAASGFGTTLNGPTVQVGNNNALAAGDVSITGNSTIKAGAAGLNVANNLDIASVATATVDNNGNNLTLSGTISDSGALTKNGNGTLVLSGNNNYSGNTTVNGGVLSVSTSANVANTPAINLNGGILQGSGSGGFTIFPNIGIGPVAGSLPGTGIIDAVSGQVFTLNGNIISSGNTGSNNLVINVVPGDNGTVVLNGVNTYNGSTVISNGTLDVATQQALQNSTLNYNNQGGTLLIDGSLGQVTLGGLTGSQNLALTNAGLAGAAVSVGNNAASTTYSGNLYDGGGAGTFTKIGSGTLTLSGAHSSMSGAVAVNGGTLVLTNGAGLFATGASVGTAGGAGLRVDGGTLVATNASTIGAPSAGLRVTAGSATYLGALGMTANAAQGDIIGVSGGSLSAASLTIGRSGLSFTAQPATGDVNNGLYITNTGVVNITGNISLGSSATTVNSSANARMDGGTLTVGGSITIGLNNGGRWSVLDVNGGTLTVADTVTGINLGGPEAGNAVLLVRNGVANVPIIGLGFGAVADTAALNVTGGSLYLGAGGIVQVSPAVTPLITLGGGIVGASADWICTNSIQLTGAATVQAADAVGNSHFISLQGPITGTGPLITSGSGTNILSAVNTFTGLTIVSNGTASLVAPGTLATTAGVAIGAGATFDVHTLGGYAFTGSSPSQSLGGNSTTGIGHLAAGGSTVTLNSGATGLFQGSGGPGGTIGKVNVAGNIALNNNVITINANGNPVGAGTYRLLDCSGSLSGAANSTPVFTGAGSTGGAASISTTAGAAGHVDLTVAKATPAVQTLPTASTNVPGTPLSGFTLTGGSVTNSSGTNVAGTFAFTTPATVPPTGTTSQSVTFTPTDTTDYNSVTLSVSVTVINPVNTNPTNITSTVVGNVLTLAWPADHTGWRLLAQTNPLTTGINPATNAWFTVTGSTTTNSVPVVLNPVNGTVFYRLVYP